MTAKQSADAARPRFPLAAAVLDAQRVVSARYDGYVANLDRQRAAHGIPAVSL